MSKLYILLAAVLVITSQTSRSVAQMVDRWDLCEDTTTMQFETFGPIFSAASPSDIAQIGLPIWRASSGRVLRHSSDSGRTWQEIFTKQEGWDRWISVVHPSASNYIIYGDTEDYYGQDRNGNYLNRYRAYFLLSSDVGATWTQMYLDTNTILRSVTMLTPTYGAAIVIHVSNVHDSLPGLLADDMIVTTDGWKSWTTHPFPSGVRGSQQLFCFRPGVFGVSTWLNSNGDSMRYLKTLDGGLTWQTHGSMPVVADIYFLNENLAWGAGTDWHVKPQNPLLIQTTDGGATWITRLDRDVSVLHWGEGLNQVAFGDSLHGIACGSRILETTDGGVTWSSNQPPFDAFSRQNGGMNIQGLIMPAANFALAVSGSPGIRFIGQQRLALPNLHEHDPGPMAIAPTTVAWVPVTGAVRYELQLAINPPWAGSAQKVFDYVSLDTVIADTLCSFTPIPAETYYARVRAIGQQSLDTSDWRWSGEWYQLLSMFNTVSKAGMQLPPRVLEPALGATVDGHV
ncbi:MAG: hypothetical protein Q8921_14870, partial [Bacteroidota bacterium]|nr:hypothetical protein [Bacteroidota bacterium]